jgi:hypothetical protein
LASARTGGLEVTGDIDWVIAVRQGDDNDELRYAIRSVRANVSGVRDIVIAGYRPAWLDGVRHISVPQDGNKFANVVRVWRSVAEHPEISDRFVFANDDEFVMRSIHVTEATPRDRGKLDLHIRRLTAIGHNSAWRRRLESTLELLRTLDAGSPLSCALHIPMLVERASLAQVYRRLGEKMIGRDPMTIWVALAGIGSTRVPHDVKIVGRSSDPGTEYDWREWQWLSTSDASFRNHPVGQYIRESFPVPSEHEADAPGHVPAAVRMTDMGYTYRNDHTNDTVTYPERNARLDRLRNWRLISEPPAAPEIKMPEPQAPAMRTWLNYRGGTFEAPEDATMYDGALTHKVLTPEDPTVGLVQALTLCGGRACPTKLRQMPAPTEHASVTCPNCLKAMAGIPDDWEMPAKNDARPEPETFD